MEHQDVFLYNSLNQVTRKSSKDGVTNYEYDNRGNLVKETTEGKVTSYEYNGFDNLTKIQNESGYQINRYDSFGNRVNILHNGREKNRILNGSSMIAENNNKGNQMNEFTRGYNLLATTQESTSYYMSSHRGDVYDLVSSDGEVVNKYRYDEYGKIEEETENIYNPYKYSGYEQNLVGNTYNLGVRTYNPEIGRFIQEDTYLGDGLNLYAYVSGNPLKYVDPSGYCKEEINPEDNNFNVIKNRVSIDFEYSYNEYRNEVFFLPIQKHVREALIVAPEPMDVIGHGIMVEAGASVLDGGVLAVKYDESQINDNEKNDGTYLYLYSVGGISVDKETYKNAITLGSKIGKNAKKASELKPSASAKYVNIQKKRSYKKFSPTDIEGDSEGISIVVFGGEFSHSEYKDGNVAQNTLGINGSGFNIEYGVSGVKLIDVVKIK